MYLITLINPNIPISLARTSGWLHVVFRAQFYPLDDSCASVRLCDSPAQMGANRGRGVSIYRAIRATKVITLIKVGVYVHLHNV